MRIYGWQRGRAVVKDVHRAGIDFRLRNSFLLAMLLNVVVYDLLLKWMLDPDGRAFAVLVGPTWIPRAEGLLFGWGLIALVFKLVILRWEQRSLRLAMVPVANPTLNAQELQTLQEVYPFGEPEQGLLSNRIAYALTRYVPNSTTDTVRETLRQLADNDVSSMESSYTYLRFFVWAIPILGFIGTVVGVSDAIAGFNVELGQIRDVSQVRGALGKVTAGLAVAFDTTYLALVLSLLLMFAMTAIQKLEQDLLHDVDQVLERWILPRLPTQERRV